MKNSVSITKSLCIIFVLAVLSSCKKEETPAPTAINTCYPNIISIGNHDPYAPVTKLTLVSGTNGKDASFNSLTPTANSGNGTYLAAMAWTVSGSPITYRFLLDFDLSAIPANAKITKAKLTLYADTTTVYYGSAGLQPGHSTLSGNNDAALRRVTSAWTESTVTWNTKPSIDEVNKITLPVSTDRSESYSLDVLTLVKDEHSNPTLYHGFDVSLNNESYYRALIFYSGESVYSNLQPKLEIEYQ